MYHLAVLCHEGMPEMLVIVPVLVLVRLSFSDRVDDLLQSPIMDVMLPPLRHSVEFQRVSKLHGCCFFFLAAHESRPAPESPARSRVVVDRAGLSAIGLWIHVLDPRAITGDLRRATVTSLGINKRSGITSLHTSVLYSTLSPIYHRRDGRARRKGVPNILRGSRIGLGFERAFTCKPAMPSFLPAWFLYNHTI
jgi:hypothetical protein